MIVMKSKEGPPVRERNQVTLVNNIKISGEELGNAIHLKTARFFVVLHQAILREGSEQA